MNVEALQQIERLTKHVVAVEAKSEAAMMLSGGMLVVWLIYLAVKLLIWWWTRP